MCAADSQRSLRRRDAIWQALKARHCYATTGERILLEFACAGARMGDAIVAPSDFTRSGFELRVEGTAPLPQGTP